jgi:hypothetical protein
MYSVFPVLFLDSGAEFLIERQRGQIIIVDAEVIMVDLSSSEFFMERQYELLSYPSTSKPRINCHIRYLGTRGELVR